MLKETETEETIVFFVTFLSLVAFQLKRARAPSAPPWLRLWARASRCELRTGLIAPLARQTEA